MSKTNSKSCEADLIEQHNRSKRRPSDQEKHLLIEALSKAADVTGNKSFDHTSCSGSHPESSSLRSKLEQRWNDLVRATASNTSSTGNTDHGGISEVQAKKDGHLQLAKSSSSWLEQIYDRHTEPGRHYHTVVHLWEMFELLDIVIANVSAPKWYVPMAWSVFFHDSIYNPKSNRNEKDSAELFREFVDAFMVPAMNKATFDTAMTMILATEKHKVIPPGSRAETTSREDQEDEISMQEHFLDIDMAVLGKQRDAYLEYAALIRKEYEFVPHDVYCSKRAEILDKFLVGNNGDVESDSSGDNTSGEKYIYLSESFREAFEKRARENLRDEIELLRKNIIPG